MPEFSLHSISSEQIDSFLPNFIYALILTTSSLRLLHIIFYTFVPELWPLIYTRTSFPLYLENILKELDQTLYILLILGT